MADEAHKIFKPGDIFGDYTIEKLLGKGGMGMVYLAKTADDAKYAIKLMHPDKMTPDLRKRFAREAEFAMKIRHKNLIKVYDVGEDPDTGYCYIIMDYISGGTLADLLTEHKKLPVSQAVNIISRIAAALDVAHKNGMIHRDIKPENIMFDKDGTPKLADLGVAKFDDESKTMVTMTGMIIGTPAYMSPEQLMDSHHIDARADIYSLGIVLYEMLAGVRPNRGCTAMELLAKAIKGEQLPDIRKMSPEISIAIAHVISIMCAPKPEQRPATSVDAAKLLQKAVSGGLVIAKKSPQVPIKDADEGKEKQKSVIVKAMLLLAFLLVVGGISWFGYDNLFAKKEVKTALPKEEVKTSKATATSVAAKPEEKQQDEKVKQAEKPTQKTEAPVPTPREITVTNTVEEKRVVVVTNIVEKPSVVIINAPAAVATGETSKENENITDDTARVATIGEISWNYTLKNGKAVIGRGARANRGMGSKAAFSPHTVTDIQIPVELDGFKVVSIGPGAFSGCRNLRELEIPDGIERLEAGAITGCMQLRKISLAPSVKKVDRGAVAKCPALREIKLNMCEDFGGIGFCARLERVGVSYKNEAYTEIKGALYTKDKKRLLFYPRVNKSASIEGSVIEIGNDAFHDCSRLLEIKLPNNVQTIGEGAFWGCKALKKIDLGESLKVIEKQAFVNCTSLTEIELPATVENLKASIFSGCEKLRRIDFLGDFPSSNTRYGIDWGPNIPFMEIVVRRGTKGWTDPSTGKLIQEGPPVRYNDEKSLIK